MKYWLNTPKFIFKSYINKKKNNKGCNKKKNI